MQVSGVLQTGRQCSERLKTVQSDKTGEGEIKMIGLNVKSLMKTKCKDKRLKTMIAIPRDQCLTALQRQSRTSHPMAYTDSYIHRLY